MLVLWQWEGRDVNNIIPARTLGDPSGILKRGQNKERRAGNMKRNRNAVLDLFKDVFYDSMLSSEEVRSQPPLTSGSGGFQRHLQLLGINWDFWH